MSSATATKKRQNFQLQQKFASRSLTGATTMRRDTNLVAAGLVHEVECGDVMYDAARVVARVGLARYLRENPPTPPVLSAQAVLSLQK